MWTVLVALAATTWAVLSIFAAERNARITRIRIEQEIIADLARRAPKRRSH